MFFLNKNKSVVDTFTKNGLVLIVLSAVTIGILISLFSYSRFLHDSDRLESESRSLYKTTLQREVSRVEELILFERSKLDSLIRKSIKDRVYEAHATATALYEKYRNIKTKKEIEILVIESLRPQRFFEGRGYFYAIALDGTSKLSPITPQFEETNMMAFKTKSGDYFVKKMTRVARDKGEGFYEHTWSKPDKDGEFDKISFVKHFAPFNWLIGTGDYVVNVEQTIKNKILDQISKIRFGKEGYIFVVNYDGVVMMNMGQPSIIGTNIINVADAGGIKVAAEVIKLAQTPSWDGYFNYSWKKRTTSETSPKIAFHKTVPEWRWYYGTGVYVDDLNNEIDMKQDGLRNDLLMNLFIIITTIFLSISFLLYLSKKRGLELHYDISRILRFFESLSVKSEAIDVDKFEYSEFKKLADSANIMLDKQKKAECQRLEYEKQILQSQKMTALNQMVGGISHDFNNLLAVIQGYGELLELKLNHDESLKNYAHQINIAGKRGAKLTGKLLSLTENKSAEAERCDINLILREEEDFLKKSLTAKVKLTMSFEDELWPVFIDRSGFEDVILNLCVNAMHAMHEGQQDFELVIATENTHINVAQQKTYNLSSGDYVKVTVSDNGIGMNSDIKDRVFEPFFTTRQTGHGLGLSQVYSFSKQSNGTVIIHSKAGEGTSFELLIPRDLVKYSVKEAQDTLNHDGIQGNATILVVEDESALRQLAYETLTHEGYKVLQAENGVEALAVLEQEEVDLVLSDIIMPVMDGNVLVEKIRLLYPDMKIQLMSGYLNKEDLPAGNEEIYDRLLGKPVEGAKLLNRIKSLLDNKSY